MSKTFTNETIQAIKLKIFQVNSILKFSKQANPAMKPKKFQVIL